MNDHEKVLLVLMNHVTDQQYRAVLLQSYIQENGPLSEEAGAKVRELLAKTDGAQPGVT
jgi:hypothetical protein